MRSSGYAITTVQLAEWNAVVQQFEEHTVFHLLPWLLAIAATHHLKIMLKAVHLNGRCVAVWPLLQMRKGLFKIVGSPLPGWSTPYLGPLFKPDVNVQSAMAAFLEDPALRRSSFVSCKVLDRGAAVDLGQFGFDQVLRYDTYRLDLARPETDLWSGLRRECRNHIRKAQKSNLRVEFESNADFIDDYWAMTVETFARNGIKPTHSRETVEQMWKHLQPANQIKALSAFHEGRRIATIVLLNDHRTTYYWGGASHLQYRHLPAHNLLQWEAICDAQRRGHGVYDFISTTGGPGKFKSSFGPECIMMATHWERCSSPLIRVLKAVYARYLRRRQHLGAASHSEDEPKSVTPPACA